MMPGQVKPRQPQSTILTMTTDIASAPPHFALQDLAQKLTGELHFDAAMRTLYATDASEYQELPVAVAMPASQK